MAATARPKAVVSWSTGKDSAWAAHVVREGGALELVGALTTLTREHERVSMHGVRTEVLRAQVARLGLPLHEVVLPWPCPNEAYERAMGEAVDALVARGVTHVVFGDLFLEDIRAYRERQLAGTGLTPVFPLWGRDTRELAEAMIDGGLRATLVSVDPRQLDASFAGRAFDEALLRDLPASVDPCGERGEMHTVVTAGPMLSSPIATRVGEVTVRDGFVYADVLLA